MVFGAAFLVGASGFACMSHAETIEDAIATAVTTHPSVTAAKEAQGASEQTVLEQKSGYFPELSANSSFGRVYGDNATSRGLSVTRGAGYSWYGDGTASVTQKVYDWGETGSKVDAAKARRDAAGSMLMGAQEAIALRAAQSYIGLLRASELQGRAAENLSKAQDYQTKIAAQVEAGGSDEAELNRANDFLLLAQNAATEFDGQYQQALADYIEATGAAPQTTLKAPGDLKDMPGNIEDAVSSAYAVHPQIMAAKAAVAAGAKDVEAEATAYMPKFSGQLSYREMDQDDIIGGESTDARAVMKMDWAYSTGGAMQARVHRAEALNAQAKAQLDETIRRVERDVRVAWSALDIARKQQATQADRKNATAKVVDTYKTQYEGSKRTLIELMQAESQAFDASIAYDNANYGVINAGYTLLAAMGRLTSAMHTAPSEQTAAYEQTTP